MGCFGMKNKKIISLFLGLFLCSVSSLSFAEEVEVQNTQEKEWEQYFGDNDPLEGLNRRVYYFNYGFDKYLFSPLVRGYQMLTPDFVEDRVTDFYKNTRTVGVLGNSLLQTKGRKSMRALARLSINTILGLGGLFDVASQLGMPKPYEDFGLTLAHYGVPRGPYLILPILGPRYLRDAIGSGVDMQSMKLAEFYPQDPSVVALGILDRKSRSSFEFYSTNSPFEYEYVRFIYKKYRTIQEETHQKLDIGGI